MTYYPEIERDMVHRLENRRVRSSRDVWFGVFVASLVWIAVSVVWSYWLVDSMLIK